MDVYKTTKKLELALAILDCINDADKRVEVRQRYIDNPEFVWLWPNIVKDNKCKNEITILAKQRLVSRYNKIINELSKNEI